METTNSPGPGKPAWQVKVRRLLDKVPWEAMLVRTRLKPLYHRLTPRQRLGAGAGGSLVTVGVVVALLRMACAGPVPPPTHHGKQDRPLPSSAWTAWEPTSAEKNLLEKANQAAPDTWVQVGPNKVDPKEVGAVKDHDAPVITLKLDGKDRKGNKQRVPLRMPTAAAVYWIGQDVQEGLGLKIRVNVGWQSRGAEERARQAAPDLLGVGCRVAHYVNSLDVSRRDAEDKEPLTLGVDGKLVFLKDLQDTEGLKRFKAVVRKIEASAIAKDPKGESRIIEGWVESAARDYAAGVWGMHDATMEVWRKNGWAIGHCGEDDFAPWHAEPSRKTAKCRRFDDSYNGRIRYFRRARPPAEDYINALADFVESPGAHEPYLVSDNMFDYLDEVNQSLPEDYPVVAFNRVHPNVFQRAQEPDAMVVYVKLDGKDRHGKPQRVLAREPTVKVLLPVAQEVKERWGLVTRVNFAWRDNFIQKRLRDEAPKLAAKPGNSNHFASAVDLSRVEATGKSALTLDLEGKVIFLEDLDRPEGKERFKRVVDRVDKEELSKSSVERREKIYESWLATAKKDYERGVWGMADVTMEVWRKHGWTTGHCGELSNESWHTEPISKMSQCERWDDTYNKRLLAYRKTPPPDEDSTFRLVEAVLAKPLPKKRTCRGFGCQMEDLNRALNSLFK
jgi:hypothetical protein